MSPHYTADRFHLLEPAFIYISASRSCVVSAIRTLFPSRPPLDLHSREPEPECRSPPTAMAAAYSPDGAVTGVPRGGSHGGCFLVLHLRGVGTVRLPSSSLTTATRMTRARCTVAGSIVDHGARSRAGGGARTDVGAAGRAAGHGG